MSDKRVLVGLPPADSEGAVGVAGELDVVAGDDAEVEGEGLGDDDDSLSMLISHAADHDGADRYGRYA